MLECVVYLGMMQEMYFWENYARRRRNTTCYTLQPELPKLEVRVKDGLIQIGERHFRVRIGDDVISNEALLEKAQSLVEHFFTDESLRQTMGKPLTVTHGEPVGKLRIIFTADSATVERQDGGGTSSQLAFTSQVSSKGQVKQGDQVKEAYQSKVQTLKEQFVEQQHYQRELAQKLAKFSPEVQKKAIRGILEAGHIAIRDVLGGQVPDEIADRTLNDVLQESGNEALRGAVQDHGDIKLPDVPARVSKRALSACRNLVKVFILNNLTRSPQVVVGSDQAVHIQRFNRGVRSFDLHNGLELSTYALEKAFQQDRGWPSDGDGNKVKKGTCEFTDHCNNLGALHVIANDGTSKCILTRSGRSDAPKRVQECVLNACLQQLQCTNPTGFTKNLDGSYSFQHAITSYLDRSIFKQKEPEYLDNLIKAIDAWPQEGYRVIIDGVEIILKKPIFVNQPFSPVLKGVVMFGESIPVGVFGIETARKLGLVANQQLLNRFMQQLNAQPSDELIAGSQELNKKLTKLIGPSPTESYLTPNGVIDFDKVPPHVAMDHKYNEAVAEFIRGQYHVQRNKNSETAKIWKSLYAVAFQQLPYPADKPFSIKPAAENELHAADVELFRNFLLDHLNVSNGKQCMSGSDRTGIGVALADAQERFKRLRGYDYLPLDAPPGDEHENKDLVLFKQFFKNSLKTHAKDITIYTKGYDGLNVFGAGGNPILNKYLLLEEDVPVLKQLGIQDAKADVQGLSYEDLRARGQQQYKGKVIDPLVIGGVSRSKVAKAVDVSQAKLAKREPTELTVINNHLALILEQNGIQTDGLGPLLNSKLELAISIKKLNIDEKKLAGLKKVQKETLQPEVKYALGLIINIAERRQQAKESRKLDPLAPAQKIKTGLENLGAPRRAAPAVQAGQWPVELLEL